MSALLYIRLLSGDDNPFPLIQEAFSTPIVVLPSCSLMPHLIVQVYLHVY
jgi:hypothetical protein